MAVEFWTMGGGRPTSDDPAVFDGVKQAVSAEQLGYDGIVYVDSQNLVADCYVSMALAAHATTRIQLGTGVTNSYTRHAAITASAIAAIQAESRGRAHLGIGRGDSALAHLGLAPHAVGRSSATSRTCRHIYAARKSRSSRAMSTRWAWPTPPWRAGSATSAAMGPKVPVDVAATGPRVIAAAARHADRISFNVGADVERTQWGMDVARQARVEAGLTPDIPFAAYLPLVVHDDPEEAMRIGAGQVSLFARFSTMYGTVLGPASDAQREVFGAIHENYDMHEHGRPGSAQAESITTEFERGFGVFGPPDYCVQRLGELVELGIDRFILRGSPLDPTNPDTNSSERFVSEVVPQL